MKAVFAQESLTNPDSLPLVVALMAEEDTRSSVSGFTRVDWTTGEPREDPTGGVMRRDAVVEEVVEASSGEPMATASKGAVSGGPATGEATSGEKPPGGPSSGSGRKPQVKKMPKRPTAKLMPRRKITKVKTEPGTTAKVPGKNRFKNQETKRRQKAKWEEIKKTAKEECAQPAPVFEIPARGGDVPVRSFFDPISGRRETMEVKPVDREQKFRATQSGFSRYPTENRTCYQCGEKGHLSANCRQKVRRVSLTEGVIKYEGAGETRPRVRLQGNMGSIPTAPSEAHEMDDIRPEDSASQVGGQCLGTMSSVGTTKKSLPPPPPPPMSGSPKIARSRPGVPPQTLGKHHNTRFCKQIVKSGMPGIVEEKLVCGRPPVGMCFYGKKMSVDATRQLTSHSVLTSCPPRVKMSYCDPLHV